MFRVDYLDGSHVVFKESGGSLHREAKVSKNGTKVFCGLCGSNSSNEFFQEQFAKETEIKILSDQRRTLLYSPEQCLVFDAFGYYIKSLLLPNDKLVLNKDFIFILKDQKISIEALRPRIEEFPPLDLQEEALVKDFDLYKNEYLYYLTDSKLKRIKIN